MLKHDHMQIAQINVARMHHSLDHPAMAGFVARLDTINAHADAAPGFVWRLQDESGNATDLSPFDDPMMIVNMSVWQTIEALLDFVYRNAHTEVMRQRKSWFELPRAAHMALWWIPPGSRPTLAEAKARLEHLRACGPSAHAFTFKHRFPATETAAA